MTLASCRRVIHSEMLQSFIANMIELSDREQREIMDAADRYFARFVSIGINEVQLERADVQLLGATVVALMDALNRVDRKLFVQSLLASRVAADLAHEFGEEEFSLTVRMGLLVSRIGAMSRKKNQAEIESSVGLLGLLQPLALVKPLIEIVECQYENYDGTGLPNGLRGTDIPLGGRIARIVHSFSDLKAQSMPGPDIEKELTERSGNHFDPRILPVLLQMSHWFED